MSADAGPALDQASPVTSASRARVTLSATARDVSDLARDLVSISDPAGGELVRRVAALRGQLDEMLGQAVVAARVTGTSWEEIGAALGGCPGRRRTAGTGPQNGSGNRR